MALLVGDLALVDVDEQAGNARHPARFVELARVPVLEPLKNTRARDQTEFEAAGCEGSVGTEQRRIGVRHVVRMNEAEKSGGIEQLRRRIAQDRKSVGEVGRDGAPIDDVDAKKNGRTAAHDL